MSAWIVQKEHIDLMLSAALTYSGHQFRYDGGDLDGGNVNAVGQMLVNTNYASVNHRYSEFEMPPVYEFQRVQPIIQPGRHGIVSTLKAIACYEYQSCEHPEWERSEARSFCRTLRSLLVTKLPGYKEAPWGIDHTNVIKL